MKIIFKLSLTIAALVLWIVFPSNIKAYTVEDLPTGCGIQYSPTGIYADTQCVRGNDNINNPQNCLNTTIRIGDKDEPVCCAFGTPCPEKSAYPLNCRETSTNANAVCSCTSNSGTTSSFSEYMSDGVTKCCGWVGMHDGVEKCLLLPPEEIGGCGEIKMDGLRKTDTCIIDAYEVPIADGVAQSCGRYDYKNVCCNIEQCQEMECGEITSVNTRPCECRVGELPQQTNGYYCCGWALGNKCIDQPVADCGANPGTYNAYCNCTASDGTLKTNVEIVNGQYCCGWNNNNTCSATQPASDGGGNNGGGDNNTGDDTSGDEENPYDVFSGPNSETFKKLNPLAKSNFVSQLDSPGDIVSRILLFAFPLAGLILFAMIVWGGFEMITGATSKGIEAGRQRVTAAIVGFLLLFASYWIMQIIQYIFGVVIL